MTFEIKTPILKELSEIYMRLLRLAARHEVDPKLSDQVLKVCRKVERAFKARDLPTAAEHLSLAKRLVEQAEQIP